MESINHSYELKLTRKVTNMNSYEFERLNFLSEKALNETATPHEITEFNTLLNEWNSSVELNLFGGYHKKANGKYKDL